MADEQAELDQDAVEIHVPSGLASKVRIVEGSPRSEAAEITVRVSKRRASAGVPLLGVMVK